MNSRRLRVAARKTLADCVISTGIPHRGRLKEHARFLKECEVLMPQVAGIRRSGSAATDLCWVASGRLDAHYERGLGAWDIAAGSLLIREAGGHMSAADGEDFEVEGGSIATGNATVHRALLELLASAAPEAPPAAAD